jgi:hypothetical protein
MNRIVGSSTTEPGNLTIARHDDPIVAVSERTRKAVAGISDHRGWAVVVTVAEPGDVVDRRRITLIDEGLPTQPLHHPEPNASLSETEARVRAVVDSANDHALRGLKALRDDLSPRFRLAAITLPEGPGGLPNTVAEILASYMASVTADTRIYRDALCAAAAELDVVVVRHSRRFKMPSDALLRAPGKTLGPPWREEHRLAFAAGLAALGK